MTPPRPTTVTPSLSELWSTFGRIGLLSFGGPAAQIGLMHRVLVDETKWLTEAQFLRALSFCMLLPGPEAMQLATYAGWRLRGVPGGLLAGTLFVLPGALVVGVLALAYAQYGTEPQMQDALLGLKAAVIVIVAQALYRLSSRALDGSAAVILAISAFAALFVLDLPFPLVVLAAGLWGWFSATQAPAAPPPARPRLPVRMIATWVTLWLAPLALLAAMGQSRLVDIGGFFAKLAVVSFGGAYAVLAWITQEAVEAQGWLTAEQMVDALGLAETTPGPLILVTQFVGMLAGNGAGGPGMALAAGVLTLWMTFVPCFLWIFAGAPYVETLLDRPRLAAALRAITASVVGVIASLSLWFAIHVVFAETRTAAFGPVALEWPVAGSVSMPTIALVGLASVVLGAFKFGVPISLGVLALTGWAMGAAGWIT